MTNLKQLQFTIMVALLAITATIAPCSQANAAGMLELEMENVPTVFALAVGVLPDYRGSDDYTFGFAPMIRYTFNGQERYIQLLANELTINILEVGS